MNTIELLRSNPNKKFDYVKKYLYENVKIKVVEEKRHTNSSIYRIVFNSNRNTSDFENPVSFECNGLIVEYNEITNKYTPLVIPVESINKNVVKREIIRNYNNNLYDVYPAYDGTMINLYYYNKSWRISTTKSYDATNLKFVDNKTYKEIFDNITTRLYPSFAYKKLNKNKCYTLCMKYNKFHQFIENYTNNQVSDIIRFIQSVDLTETTFKPDEGDNIGFPITGKILIKSIDELYSIANNEYARYKHSKNNPNFGYILRTKSFRKTRDYSNVIIESNLLQIIRQLLYNHSFMNGLSFRNVYDDESIEINKNYYDVPKLVILKAFLTKKRHMVLALLPQYINTFTYYDGFLTYISKYMTGNIVNSSIKSIYMKDEVKFNKLIEVIKYDMRLINTDKPHGKDTIKDYIYDIRYIDYIYNYLH